MLAAGADPEIGSFDVGIHLNGLVETELPLAVAAAHGNLEISRLLDKSAPWSRRGVGLS